MSDLQKFLDIELKKVDFGNEIENDSSLESQFENDFIVKIAMQIKNIRKKKKITQVDLAKKTGIKQSNLSNIENGTSNPNVETLYKIAKGLDVILKIDFKEE